MACPNCNCKVTYQYQVDPDVCGMDEDYWERCAHCGMIFDGELEAAEDNEIDDEDEPPYEPIS